MKVVTIAVNGKIYPLCYSARVLKECYEQKGGVQPVLDAMSNTKDMMTLYEETLQMLSRLMIAGTRYAKRNGLQVESVPLAMEELYDAFSPYEMPWVRNKVIEAMSQETPSVEAESPKNSETTQETTAAAEPQSLSGTSGTA